MFHDYLEKLLYKLACPPKGKEIIFDNLRFPESKKLYPLRTR